MYEIIYRFMISIALGVLIGIEREKTQQSMKVTGIGGIRTFMIITLMGAISAYFAELFSFWVLVVVIFCFSLFILVGYYLTSIKTKEIGLTTELSAITAFLIGVMVYVAPLELPILVTIAVTLILSFRLYLHKFVMNLKQNEFYDTIKFIIVAFIVLPLLPNKYFGPFETFNPYQIWLMVVFVSWISFVGYVLLKIFGTKKGIELTGFLGGLVSSTPVVTSMASKSKDKASNSPGPFVIAAVLASSIMFLRMLFEVYVLNPEILPVLIIPILSMAGVGFLWAGLLWRGSKDSDEEIEVRSPFMLAPAITFGLIFGVIIFLTKYAQHTFGDTGVYITSFISGLADVDAVTISMASFAKEGLSNTVAATSITLAAIANTITKLFISYFFGSKRFFKAISIVLGAMVLVGVVIVLFLQ